MNSQTGPPKRVLPLLLQPTAACILVTLIWHFATPRNATFWAGLGLTVVAAIFFVTARFQLGGSFSVSAQARHLVTHGMYSRIRNPMYVFSSLMILGTIIAFQKMKLLSMLAVLVLGQVVRAHKEGRILEAGFGNEYRAYRQRTWF